MASSKPKPMKAKAPPIPKAMKAKAPPIPKASGPMKLKSPMKAKAPPIPKASGPMKLKSPMKGTVGTMQRMRPIGAPGQVKMPKPMGTMRKPPPRRAY